MNSVRRFLVALQFFTRIPVTGPLAQWVGYSPQMLRASAGHFPGVGLLVGVLAASVYAGLALGLPDTSWTPLVAAIVSTIATVLLTGGFHEDGLVSGQWVARQVFMRQHIKDVSLSEAFA